MLTHIDPHVPKQNMVLQNSDFFFLGGVGSILESKTMHVIFQKKGKKRAKYLKFWAKMYKI